MNPYLIFFCMPSDPYCHEIDPVVNFGKMTAEQGRKTDVDKSLGVPSALPTCQLNPVMMCNHMMQ